MSDSHNGGGELKRELGLFSATIIVVANMIGTGIFTTPGLIASELPNPSSVLICWIVGGLFALCGALCYGELGAIFPEAGAEYVYIRCQFGKLPGFLSGWVSLIVGFSAPIAAASIAFSSYLFQTFAIPEGPAIALASHGVSFITLSLPVAVSIATIIIISAIHYLGLAFGSKVQNALTVFKICVIMIFILSAFFLGQGSMTHFSGGWRIADLFQEKFAVSLIFVSFAYSGWNAAAYLGAEIKRPDFTLPAALILGTTIVASLYLALNVVYIYSLPQHAINGVIEVGAKSAVALFGQDVSKYFSAAISLALLSVLSAMIMTGPRVYYAMARDNVFFHSLGKIDTAHGTPAYSIFLQGAVAVAMVVTASFDKLLIYIGFTLSIFTSLAVIGLIRARQRRSPSRPGYTTPGYPVTPIVFILGNLWTIYFSVMSRPITSLWGFLTVASGVLVFFFFQRKNASNPALK
ncbi:MAG: APC family permease [Desulfomonilaceae bacterium]